MNEKRRWWHFERELNLGELIGAGMLYAFCFSKYVSLGPAWDNPTWSSSPFIFSLKLAVLLFFLYVVTLRLRQNGYPKWQSILWFIPLVGPLYVIYLLFTKKTHPTKNCLS